MHPVKGKAKKQDVGLTVSKATADARRLVSKRLAGVDMVTVGSYSTWDQAMDKAVIITTITFPPTADASDLACTVDSLPGVLRSTWSEVAITITRVVR